MKIIEVDISKIIPYGKNSKVHTKKQIKQVADSIKRFGFIQPLVLDKNFEIVIGHCRFEGAKLLEMDKVPCFMADTLSKKEIIALRLADNKLNESAWDMKLVVGDLKELDDMGLVDLTGFSQDLLIDPDEREDDIPENPPAKTKLGDLYQLGQHRLLCGDSTKLEAVLSLMDGKKADMVFTDPPYNVNYSGSGKNTSDVIMNEKMSDTSFKQFLLDAFKAMREVTKVSAGCYVFHSHKTASIFEQALEESEFFIDTQLIWNKPSAGMGMNHYRTKHEPFFYCGLSTDKEFYGDRTGTTVWKIPSDIQRAYKWLEKEMEYQESGATSIWTMKRANVNEYVHPTQKPVELAVTAMTKSSKKEDIIFDPFLGSGTTLISAEKATRVCHGMELDPHYVDVIVQRWVDYTGITDIKVNGKKIVWPVSEAVGDEADEENGE